MTGLRLNGGRRDRLAVVDVMVISRNRRCEPKLIGESGYIYI